MKKSSFNPFSVDRTKYGEFLQFSSELVRDTSKAETTSTETSGASDCWEDF